MLDQLASWAPSNLLTCLIWISIIYLITKLSGFSRIKIEIINARIVWPKKSLIDVPGPIALPLIGTRWIYYFKYKMSKIHEAYADLFKCYGQIIKEESVWNVGVVSVKERKDIERVLRHISKYPMRPPTEVTAHYRAKRPDRYTNLGMINEQGETWHRLRSLLTPELTSSRTMLRFLPELTAVAEDFNRLIMNCRDDTSGIVCGFEDLACRIGMESTCTLILGKRLGMLENEVSPIVTQLAEAVQEQFCASRDTFFGLPFWKIYPTEAYKKFMASEDAIYDIISELVDSAQKQEEDTCEIDEGVQSVFMAILKAPGLDIRDKKAGIIDFIAAGIKTFGNTLVFMLYLLAKNKQCQHNLYQEICTLVPNNATLDSAALRNAHYLKACILESFRILPTAPCVARILETDMELSGYHLDSGSVVLCHTWLACLDETNFENAEVFVPERWLRSDGSCSTCHSHPFLVVPFGVGRRMCPGKRFVELGLQVVLALMVKQFEIEFEGQLDIEFEFLLAPKPPVDFIFKKRVLA